MASPKTSAIISSSGVISRHEVKDFPVLPDVVMLAFEKRQVGCLTGELTGPVDRQLQVLDIMLDIFQKETKAQEGIAESIMDVLIFILRSRCEELRLKQKICSCVELLSTFANARREMVNDFGKLEDFRYSVQESDDFAIRMSVLNTCTNICRYPRGADALVNAGYWKWLLATIETEKNSELRSETFLVLKVFKTECNLPQDTTAVTKSLIRLLINDHFNVDNGTQYAFNCLEFCISICRLQEIKAEFVEQDSVKVVYEKFVAPFLADSSAAVDVVALTAKALQFLGSLAVSVEGKKRFLSHACAKLFYDKRMYEQKALQQTSVQLMLLVIEHPDVRKELKESMAVAELRKMKSSAGLDQFVEKITGKTLDLLFWEP